MDKPNFSAGPDSTSSSSNPSAISFSLRQNQPSGNDLGMEWEQWLYENDPWYKFAVISVRMGRGPGDPRRLSQG